MLRSNARTRRGFTLVELMVAAAATVLVMTILSICFQAGLNSIRFSRAQGEGAGHLRAFSNTLRRDLSADHFQPSENAQGVSYRGRRVSDYNFAAGAVPSTGFYYLESPQGTYEGNDQSFDSYRNTGCRMWFTSVLPGGTDDNLYSAIVNGNTVLTSEAAEVAYFLVQTGQTFGNNPLPIFNLHRRQRLVATNGTKQAQFSAFLPANNAVISQHAGNANLANTMADVASVGRSPTIFTPLGNGDDIVLSNVLSFEVKAMWQHFTLAARNPLQFGAGNHDFPFDNLTTATGSAGVFSFDSAAMNAAPMPLRIHALQIRVRIYDTKVKTSRQMTMVLEQ